MRVVVFGATGTIGRLTVGELLAAGHAVTAFARRPEQLAPKHPKMTRIQGDALVYDDVCEAVKGQDAVIIALGAGASFSSKVRSQGTLNVIRAMQENGVKRLVCQSTLGVGDSWANLNFWWKHVMFGGVLRAVFRDHELQEKLVEASGLDWTILRPSAFTDKPVTEPVLRDFGPETRGLKLLVPRIEVAKCLASILIQPAHTRHWVTLSA